MLPIAAKKAERIIAVSSSTKKDIMKLLNISSEKIRVIYLGIGSLYHPLEKKEVEDFRRKEEIFGSFILYVGTLKKRKNVLNIIRAYKKIKEKGIKEKLVIVGNKSGEYQNIYKAVKRSKLEKDVFFSGYVDEALLPFYYNSAFLFIYPSLYEGFGLPILEAMASGTPVITSNVSSLPEVVGDAAILVNPNNIEEMAEMMQKVLTNQKLREKMREKGLKRAKLFSWERCARETLNLYEEIGGG